MERNFLTALIPDPAWCLGVRLKPFSLGHLVLLRRIGSPFVSPAQKQVELGDLILAVILCADKFEAGVEYLGTLDHASAADKETLEEWGAKAAKLDLNEEVTAFMAYIRAADVMPQYFHSAQGETQQIGSPFWQVVYLNLHKLTNLIDTEIWNQPLGKTYCDYIAIREQEQVLRIKTEEDEQVEQMAREYYAKRAAQEESLNREPRSVEPLNREPLNRGGDDSTIQPFNDSTPDDSTRN